MPYRIRYTSVKFRDSLLRIQTEERVKVEAKPKKDTPMPLQVLNFLFNKFKVLIKTNIG